MAFFISAFIHRSCSECHLYSTISISVDDVKAPYDLICYTCEVNLCDQGLGYSFVIKRLLSIHDILSSILSIKEKKRKGKRMK